MKGHFETVAIVGFSGSVSRDENRSAHGGVCLLQARRNAKGEIIGRKVNSNGRHQEVGESFRLDLETLEQWERIAKSYR